MALQAILDAIDGLPADVAKEYKQRDDGKFVLDVTPVDGVALENVTALKGALSKERTRAASLEKTVKAFEGMDPEAAREALAKIGDFKEKALTADQKVAEATEMLKRQMAAEHKKTVEKLEGASGNLRKQLEQNLIVAAATSAISEAKGSVRLLLPHVRQMTRMRELEDGRFVVEVVDDSGNVRVGDGSGNPMTIPQLISELRGTQEFARAFDASGAAGSGANGGNGSAGNGASGGGNGKVRTISRSDQKALNSSLEDIASGKAVVVD